VIFSTFLLISDNSFSKVSISASTVSLIYLSKFYKLTNNSPEEVSKAFKRSFCKASTSSSPPIIVSIYWRPSITVEILESKIEVYLVLESNSFTKASLLPISPFIYSHSKDKSVAIPKLAKTFFLSNSVLNSPKKLSLNKGEG
jgi:hypothetical protein